jgi:PAS domain S-box-containing protein
LGKGYLRSSRITLAIPSDSEATGVANLTDSLNKVLSHKKPHEMAVQKYDIKRPNGDFEVRYWSPKNLPVLDTSGKVTHIIHCVTDVTQSITQSQNQLLADQEIIRLQQRHDSVFDQDFVAVAVLRGNDYVIEQANSTVCQIWGRTRNEVIGKPILKALPELDGQGVDSLLNNVLQTGERYIGKELPVKLKRKGKLETVYFNFVYVPMRDEASGEITGITVLATDATDQVKIRQQVEDSEERFRTLIEQSPLSTQILSPDGKTLQVNKAWEQLWGAKIEQLESYNMLKDKQLMKLGIMPYIKKGFKGKATFIPAVRYEPGKTIKGVTNVAYRWVQAYIYPVKNSSGVIREVVLIHQDITEQRKAQEALKNSEIRWRFLTESMPEKIFTANTSGRIDYINQLWVDYTGEVLEKSNSDWTQLIHLDDIDQNVKQWQHSLDTGDPFEIEHRIRRKDGEYRWHITRANALRNSSGTIIKWIGSNTDIEDLRRKQELEKLTTELTEQRARLVALNQAKDEFISLASHQLRTPATAVKQYLGMVLEGYAGKLTKAQVDMINQANTSNERQITIVNDLLKVASLDSGKMQLQKRWVKIAPLVQDVLDGHKSVFGSRKQEIEFTTKQDDISAEVDPDRIRMVLENIIDNASKYTPEGKKILVRLSKVRNKVTIAVQDEGVGINQENMNKLFRKFSRLDNPLSILVGGTGLGLYWAKKVIDLHGGSIEVDSIPNKGSTFTVNIPARAQ